MSGLSERPAEASSLRRLLVVGAIAVLVPMAIGGAAGYTQPGHQWRVEGLGPFLVICLGFVAYAAGMAALAGTQHVAVGTMSGVALAVGSIVREGSPIGALIALAAGAAGGVLAATYATRKRVAPDRAERALALVAIVLAVPVGFLARVGPVSAADAYASGSPPLATATHASLSWGYVLHGKPGTYLEGASLVRVRRQGIGSWTYDSAIQLPNECQFPHGTNGSDLPWVSYFGFTNNGVLVNGADIERVCRILSDRIVVGIAPAGTRTIEASSLAGRSTRVPMGLGRSYILLVPEEELAVFDRIAFHDARGRLLDSKPLIYGTEHMDTAALSRLTTARAFSDRSPEHTVTVSYYIISSQEYRMFCGAEPPYGDGLVAIAIVRRDDGVTREVVVGSGTPLSSEHPDPDPPLVRPSNGRPCFVPA